MKNLTFEEMESVEKEKRSKKPGIRIYPTYEIMFESDCSYTCYLNKNKKRNRKAKLKRRMKKKRVITNPILEELITNPRVNETV